MIGLLSPVSPSRGSLLSLVLRTFILKVSYHGVSLPPLSLRPTMLAAHLLGLRLYSVSSKGGLALPGTAEGLETRLQSTHLNEMGVTTSVMPYLSLNFLF